MAVPVAVPSVWIQLTEPQSARAVRRLELVPRDVVPAGDRPHDRVLAVEAFPERLNAYVAYVNEDPRVFFAVIETDRMEYSFTIDEAMGTRVVKP